MALITDTSIVGLSQHAEALLGEAHAAVEADDPGRSIACSTLAAAIFDLIASGAGADPGAVRSVVLAQQLLDGGDLGHSIAWSSLVSATVARNRGA